MEECRCVVEVAETARDYWTTVGIPLLSVAVGALMTYLGSRALQKRAWDRKEERRNLDRTEATRLQQDAWDKEQERQAEERKLQGRIKFHERKLGIIRETQLALTRLLEWCTHRAVNCKTGDPVAYPPTADLHQVMYGIAAIDDDYILEAKKAISNLDELSRKHGGHIRPSPELRTGLVEVIPQLMEIVSWAGNQWHLHSRELLKLTEQNHHE